MKKWKRWTGLSRFREVGWVLDHPTKLSEFDPTWTTLTVVIVKTPQKDPTWSQKPRSVVFYESPIIPTQKGKGIQILLDHLFFFFCFLFFLLLCFFGWTNIIFDLCDLDIICFSPIKVFICVHIHTYIHTYIYIYIYIYIRECFEVVAHQAPKIWRI